MHKHIKMLISTICFIAGLYIGDAARNKIIARSK